MVDQEPFLQIILYLNMPKINCSVVEQWDMPPDRKPDKVEKIQNPQQLS